MSRAVGSDVRLGSELAGYRIVGVLGRGATSTVYRAAETKLGREVALKVLSPESQDRGFQRRFLRESKIAASLQHPNVIPIYSAGEADGQLYIAMRLIEGSDLKALLHSRGRLPADRTIALCLQLAGALDAAHAAGLVHRDVKPSNVLLERDHEGEEHVFLADFGLTKTAAASATSTRAGQMVGTIDYMAPEQIRGEQVDGRADLYSLGCLLYECLVGEPPFARGSEVATLYAQLHDPPPPATERRPVLPKEIDAVFARALAKDPSDRYATGAELVAAARTALRLPEQAAKPWRMPRRRRTLLVAAIAAVAAAAAGIALVVGGSDQATARPIHARVALTDYRVTATERMTSGLPGAYPMIGLTAAVDSGQGPVAVNQSPRATGELDFHFDHGQLDGGAGNAFGAAPGSLLGYLVDWSSTGGTLVQMPVRKSGLTDGNVVHARVELPPEWRPIGPVVPLVLHSTPSDLVATLNLQDVVGKIRAAGLDTRSAKYVGLYLLNAARNPFQSTPFRASISARPCADRNCRRLGPAASDAIAIALPQDLSVQAPARAVYGKPAPFTGTGVPGKLITVAYTNLPGPAPDCTPNTVSSHRCGPKLGPAWEGDDTVNTTVRGDGTWSLAVPLTPALGDGFGPSGRYSAVEESDDSLHGGPLFGGAFSVFQEASTDTVVRLAKPVVTLTRQSRELAVGITVKGGDSLVHYRLRFGGHDVSGGSLTSGGTAAATIPAPRESGAFQVAVSAPDTESATASVPFRSAISDHARSALPGFRVTASERVTSGAPHAFPTIGLIAAADIGRGPVAKNLARVSAGEVTFDFDRRQLNAEGGVLVAAATGTRIGYYVDGGSSGFVQYPVTKTGVGTDPTTGETLMTASIALPPEIARLVGPRISLVFRLTKNALAATLDLRPVVQAFRKAGARYTFQYGGLYLLPWAAGNGAFTINPSDPTKLHAAVSIRPCTDTACRKLGRPAGDAVVVELPQQVSVQAPRHAVYGEPTTFTGTGVPGSAIGVVLVERPGRGQVCTPSNVDLARCAPPIAPAWIGDPETYSTLVHADGTWSLVVPLSLTVTNRAGLTGRYAADESPDRSLEGGPLFGGASTLIQQAGQDTVVSLAKPAVTATRRGNAAVVEIAVPGGDGFVHYSLRSGGRRLDAGRLGKDGTVTTEFPAPRAGLLQATVSAPGVRSATASRSLR